MKTTIEDIKMWGIRDWLSYYAPTPLKYIGHLWDWILPKYNITGMISLNAHSSLVKDGLRSISNTNNGAIRPNSFQSFFTVV